MKSIGKTLGKTMLILFTIPFLFIVLMFSITMAGVIILSNIM